MKSYLIGLMLALLVSGVADAASKPAKAGGLRAVCIDPSLHGAGGNNVCRISCAGFYVDVRAAGVVFINARDSVPGRFTTFDGRLNGEGAYTSISIMTSPATACAFSGFDLNGPVNPELRK